MTQPWYETHVLAPALLLAPPGCGKTEELASWSASLLTRGLVARPQRILGLTFSNKAKANLRSRLRAKIGPRSSRYVSVMNFHGLSYHVFQHHAYALGLEPLPEAPRRGSLSRLLREVAQANGIEQDALRAAIRTAKAGPFNDDTVMDRLTSLDVPAAIEYEDRLRQWGQRDFDDIIRLGLRTLAVEGVAELYVARFPAMLVDEVQDLTISHLELAMAISPSGAVFAGDTAQGIYGFAGAEPAAVFDAIKALHPVELALEHSHRSSPAVLEAVSVINLALGGAAIEAADPASWEGVGTFEIWRFRDHLAEAEEVVSMAANWLADDPSCSVAIMARTGNRRRAVDSVVREQGLTAEIWDFPAHEPRVASLLARHLNHVDAAGPDPVGDLHDLCVADVEDSDLDTLDSIASACESLLELIAEGHSLADVVQGIRVSSTHDEPVAPGLHLLNGHVCKGQAFDHVVAIGLEEAILPMYPAMLAERRGDPEPMTQEHAVLHVMASRARTSLHLSFADSVPDRNGQPRRREPSRFLKPLMALVDEPER